MADDDPFFDDADYGEPNGHDEDEEDVNESADEKEVYDSDDDKSISSNESEDTIFGEEHDDEAGEDLEEQEEPPEEKSKKKERKTEKVVEPSKRITRPNMTKFEYSYLISQRAMMIEHGSPLMIPDTEFRNSIDIAKEETDKGLNPIIIRRPLPNGNIEEWKCSELIPSKIF
jgi:DNA-directed RNA polymerase subunit K/omega